MRPSFRFLVTFAVGSNLALSAAGCVEHEQDFEFPVAEGVLYTTDVDGGGRHPAERTERRAEDVEVFADRQPPGAFVSTGVLFTWAYSNARSVERLRERAALAGLDGIYWIDCTSPCVGLCTAKGFVYTHGEADPAPPEPEVPAPPRSAPSAAATPPHAAPPIEEEPPRGVIAPSGDVVPSGEGATQVGAPPSR